MTSLELETLDQLLGGDQPLSVIRLLYPNDQHFAKSIHKMLLNRDIQLLTEDNIEIPLWRWRELFVEGSVISELTKLRISITEQGGRRIA